MRYLIIISIFLITHLSECQAQSKPEFYIRFLDCLQNLPVTLYINKVEIFNNQLGTPSLTGITDLQVKQDSTGLSVFSGGQSRSMPYLESFILKISLTIGDQKLNQDIIPVYGKYLYVVPPCKTKYLERSNIILNQYRQPIAFE